MKTLSKTFVLICAFLLAYPYPSKAQQNLPRYVFASNSSDQDFRLLSVDPLNPNTIEPLITFPKATYGSMRTTGTLSPNGRLLPVFFNPTSPVQNDVQSPIGIRLINIDGTISTIIDDKYNIIPLDAVLYGYPKTTMWSSDGRYLAMLLRSLPSDTNGNLSYNTDIFIYDVEAKTTRNITNDSAAQGQFAWSPDSQKLAFASVACEKTCQPTLDIYDVKLSVRQFSSSVNNIRTQGLRAETSLCLFAWSPDSSKVIYRVNCQGYPFDYQELHVFDLATNSQTRLTNYTRPPQSERDTTYYNASQFPVWYNSDLVMVGGYQALINPLEERTDEDGYIETYSLSAKKQTILAQGRYILEWATTSQQGQYVALEANPGSDGFKNPSLKTQLLSYSNNSLQVSLVLPTGCQFDWDEGHQYLMYNQYAQGSKCSGTLTNYVFFNLVTGQTTSLPASNVASLVPVGWLQIGGSASTPTPFTSTPIPSFRLTPLCSPQPDLYRSWQIINPNATNAIVDWEVIGTQQKGVVLAKASADTIFQTSTITSDSNTVRISVNGVVQDTQISDPSQCVDPSPTPAPTFTPTIAPTQTPTVTPTPSRTPSPTLPPLATKLKLTSLCSPAPAQVRVWRVRNSNAFDVPFTWDVYGTQQRGTGIASANADVTFQTATVANSPNTVRVFVNGVLQDTKASGTTQCTP